MSDFGLITLSVTLFSLIVLALVLLILFAKSKLVASGNIAITINENPDQALDVPVGGKLLNTLVDQQIFVPSACGGGGTCGECKVVVNEGGGDILLGCGHDRVA